MSNSTIAPRLNSGALGRRSSMCLGVYLASDTELTTIPFHEWAPAFNVTELEPHEESVRQVFRRPFIYSLGAHTSCGCGFQPEDESAPEDFASTRSALTAYLARARAKGPIDVYVCWNGDAEIPTQLLELTPRQMEDQHHWLIEGSFIEVLLDAA